MAEKSLKMSCEEEHEDRGAKYAESCENCIVLLRRIAELEAQLDVTLVANSATSKKVHELEVANHALSMGATQQRKASNAVASNCSRDTSGLISAIESEKRVCCEGAACASRRGKSSESDEIVAVTSKTNTEIDHEGDSKAIETDVHSSPANNHEHQFSPRSLLFTGDGSPSHAEYSGYHGGVTALRTSDQAQCIICQTPDDCLEFGEVFARVTPSELVGIRRFGGSNRSSSTGDDDTERTERTHYNNRVSDDSNKIGTWEIVFKEGGGNGELRRMSFDDICDSFEYVSARVEEWDVAMSRAGSLIGVGNKELSEAKRELFVSSREYLVPSAMSSLQASTSSLLTDQSSLLTSGQTEALVSALPRRFRQVRWKLIYSTARDGTSLKTFFRKSDKLSPTVLVVRDEAGYIFGCYAPESWMTTGSSNYQKNKYYGTGETFVFQLVPNMIAYRWSRKNNYFITSSPSYIAVGGGGESCVPALYIDKELLHGSSGECETFQSQQLSKMGDFQIRAIELWHIHG